MPEQIASQSLHMYAVTHQTPDRNGSAGPPLAVEVPIKIEQGIPNLVPALKLCNGCSFSVLCRARSGILLSGAQLQSSTQLLSTIREHWLEERKVLRHVLPPTPAPRSPWAILGDEPSPENVVASQSRTFLSGHMYDTAIKRLLEAATSRRN
jgi:hypothetical protein